LYFFNIFNKIKLKKRIGTEQRGRKYSKNVPGPGQYTLNTSIGGGPMFSISLKTKNFADTSKHHAFPGPANYSPNFKALYRNCSYTMRSRPNTAKVDSNPGPGNYNLRTEKSLMAPTYK